MSDYPIKLLDKSLELDGSILSDSDQHILSDLNDRGYKFYYGLDESFAGQLQALSQEDAIREYCPKDHDIRFYDIETTKLWLAKGRQAYLLVKEDEQNNKQVLGYGWAGTETSEDAPGGKTTFALRLAKAASGQGLSTPFCKLIIAASHAQFGSDYYWLETWASNGAAVHVYTKLGFQEVKRTDSVRLTASGDPTPDTRLYMTLPNDKL